MERSLTAGLWHAVFNSDSQFYSADFGSFESKDVLALDGECDGLSAHAHVDIASYSALIFSQKRQFTLRWPASRRCVAQFQHSLPNHHTTTTE